MTEGSTVEREKWNIWCYTFVKITLILCPISVCFHKHLTQTAVYFISLAQLHLFCTPELQNCLTLWTFYLFINSNLNLIDIFHHSVRYMCTYAIQ